MRKISNPRQSISSVLHCAQYTYCFFPSKEPDSSVRRSPMSNSHVQSAKAIAEDIAHLCCVPDDWRLQISDLAAWVIDRRYSVDGTNFGKLSSGHLREVFR